MTMPEWMAELDRELPGWLDGDGPWSWDAAAELVDDPLVALLTPDQRELALEAASIFGRRTYNRVRALAHVNALRIH